MSSESTATGLRLSQPRGRSDSADRVADGGPEDADEVAVAPLTLADGMPLTGDPAERALRDELASSDVAVWAHAALRLGAHYVPMNPRVGEPLLRQAAKGPPLTAARAMLHLAHAKYVADDAAAARELLASAQDTTKVVWRDGDQIDEELLAVRIDVAHAFATVGQPSAAIDILSAADTAVRKLMRTLAPGDPDDERLRRLRGVINLRLGQTQRVGDRSSADAAYRLASQHGSRSVAATAALDLGCMLEQHGGDGPDIEEQYRRAAESGDPIVAPLAMISLGDLLWRNTRRDAAKHWWGRALEIGGREIPARVERRLSRQWPADVSTKRPPPPSGRPAAPVGELSPPTSLGRVASGRASTYIAAADGDRVKVIVVGAGTGGHYLLPGLQFDYEVVGYVDDDPEITAVDDVPVLGPIDELGTLLQRHPSVGLVIFAIPTATGSTRRRVLQAVRQCRRRLLSLPSMFELMRGHPLVPQLRPMEVHETFGDVPWTVDRAAAALVRGRRVAIIGAGSWLGEELAHRVANGQARHLLLIDDVGGPLRRVLDELRELHDVIDCDAKIVDCAERLGLEEVFATFKPEIVFHCGGLNHSPSEVLPLAHAARVNIVAADTVATVAKEHGASDLIVGSADRAAHRAVGFDMTKALAERVVLARATRAVHIDSAGLSVVGDGVKPFRVSVLRLPNVWANEGPVVGRLVHQLKKGGPIRAAATTERCFIHAWEAAQALLRLVDSSHGGGLFAYRGGEVLLIREIAERLIWMNGLTAGRDVTIVDHPSAETKVKIGVIGAGETAGATVAHETCVVSQSPELVEHLDNRVQLVREAWQAGNGEALASALAPDDADSASVIAAG
jgi:FlaA1/EpsC-like NDP-sugar epimerase